MTTQTIAADKLQVAKDFVEAYARADYDRVEALLAPHVHQREVTPGGFVEWSRPQQVIQEEKDFLARFDRFETVDLDVEPFADRVRARTCWRLWEGDEAYLCEWYEFIRIEDGKVAGIDIVCSGSRPE